jgi:hypothetical protein
MSGATAAHASYNGSGTQGLAVTNKINDTGDIMSVFWTKDKTTKQLLHGCALIEIPSSGGSETPGSNLTFTMNSDMDVIGDLYVYVTLKMTSASYVRKEYGLLNLFERIEFQCGTQIWQTLEFADILALNTTELSEGAYEKFILSAGGFFDATGGIAGISSAGTALDFQIDSGETRAFSFRLPLLTRNLGPMLNNYANISESGFLTAAAPNQTVKIKFYTNKTATMLDNKMISVQSGTDTMNLRLFGKHMIMCNEEREKIRSIPGGIAKRLKLTQYRDSLTNTVSSTGICNLELDCDHFSLYASHIIIQIFDNTTYAEAENYKLTGVEGDYNDECCTLLSADLKLNSTSFCGPLTGGMMSGPLPESMGLYVNNFNSRTDPHTRTILYVFPLANKAFSGSGVPLNRFDNIRLSLKIYSPLQAANSVRAEIKKVSATCVGETTALYKQGAASISMY